MSNQGQIIQQIDQRSEQLAGESNDKKTYGLYSLYSLTLLPAMKCIKTLTLGGAMFRGVEGLKEAGNEWAIEFVTNAKVYEKKNGDTQMAVEKSRDYL